MEGWLTLAEAARATGLTADTIRRRIKRGELVGRKMETAYGPAWQVHLNGATQGVAEDDGEGVVSTTPCPDGTTPRVAGTATDAPALLEALRMLDQRDRTIMELSGRVGYYQALVEQLRETVRALEAPRPAEVVSEPTPAADGPSDAPQRSWWRRWWG